MNNAIENFSRTDIVNSKDSTYQHRQFKVMLCSGGTRHERLAYHMHFSDSYLRFLHASRIAGISIAVHEASGIM